jgi:hypothetical protein
VVKEKSTRFYYDIVGNIAIASLFAPVIFCHGRKTMEELEIHWSNINSGEYFTAYKPDGIRTTPVAGLMVQTTTAG